MGDSNKQLYAKMVVDVVLGPILEKVNISFLASYNIEAQWH